MTSYLFLLTLGPIQEFIAAARRTRDLWAGSQLLSDLSREAAVLLQAEGAELIFPAQAALEPNQQVVNRLLALVTVPPETLGPAITDKLRAWLRERAVTTFHKVPGLRQSGTLEYALNQVTELLEVYWAGVLRTANYQLDRDNVEAALAACKNTRAFAHPAYRAMVPKSSLDGSRESVIPKEYYASRGDGDKLRKQKITRLRNLFGAGQAEQLSGVDLLKRHAQGTAGESDFPSTSHFAALPWLYRHQDSVSAFDAYLRDAEIVALQPARLHSKRFQGLQLLRTTASIPYDATVLYAERLGEDADQELDEQTLLTARTRLEQLYQAIGSRPAPYYAILHADGDNMGKVIDHQATKGVAQHQQFSRDLDAFAAAVRHLVEHEQRGALVYAGGDDVLAFMPLDTVLVCAKELAELFAKKLKVYTGAQGELPTLSVGIAICHHIEPLSDALDLARRAERAAKSVKGKNALAITLSKRSGVDTTVSGSWHGQMYTRLERFIALYRADELPDGVAYELRNLDERVGRTLAAEALKVEALRILRRKRRVLSSDATSTTQADKPDVAKTEETWLWLASELASGASERRSDQRPVWGVNELADELIIAREFAQVLGLQRREEKEQAV